MSLLGLFMSFALVASASAICCVPEKYTTWVRAITYIDGSFYTSEGVQYFDATLGKSTAFTNTSLGNGLSSISNAYHDILSGDIYTVNEGRCTKTKLLIQGINKDKPNCIASTAGNVTTSPSFTIGGPHEDLQLLRINIPVKNGLMELTVTKNHCIPVHQNMHVHDTIKETSKVMFATNIDYMNLIPTVHDSSVFAIPDICKNVTS